MWGGRQTWGLKPRKEKGAIEAGFGNQTGTLERFYKYIKQNLEQMFSCSETLLFFLGVIISQMHLLLSFPSLASLLQWQACYSSKPVEGMCGERWK